MKLRLPGPNSRTLIVGRTGSGKTVAALWQLSERDYAPPPNVEYNGANARPWVVIDYKRDENIANIEGAEYISLSDPLPTEPGIYILQPRPDQDAEVEEWLWRVWERGKIGLYVDEGYILPKSGKTPAFTSILTQGRSKGIPVIILSQRPTWINRFAISESDFYQIFHLNDARDRKTIGAFIPGEVDERLDEYHSIWYDVGRDVRRELGPVPGLRSIQATFRNRLMPKVPVEEEKPKIRVL